MKKIIRLMLLLVGVLMWASEAQAQSWMDIFNSETLKKVVTSVTGGQTLSAASLQGTWTYVDPAVQMKGDNALKQVAGSVATAELEKKLKEQCAKVGIEEGLFNYTFNADSTFTSCLKKGTLNGTYSVDPEAKTVTLTYKASKTGFALYTMTAEAELLGDNLTLLFNADKLLAFMTKVAELSSNSTLQSLSKLANEYDGVMLGFDLKK